MRHFKHTFLHVCKMHFVFVTWVKHALNKYYVHRMFGVHKLFLKNLKMVTLCNLDSNVIFEKQIKNK